jgi:hypothetical protein
MTLGYLVHLIVALLALTGIVPTVAFVSPVKLGHRHIPVITTAGAFACWYLPTGIDSALALVPLAALALRLLSVHVVPDEAADWSPAKAATVSAASRARGTVGSIRAKLAATATRIRRKPGTPPEPVEVTGFVKGDEDFVQGDTASDEPGDAAPVPHGKQAPVEKFDWQARLKEIHSPENAHKFGTREAF